MTVSEAVSVSDVASPARGRRVAIIGAGAVGTCCANYLLDAGFEVEVGYGAREVDDADWAVVHHRSGSTWGHRRPA